MTVFYLVIVLIILLSFLLHLTLKRYNYWKSKNVPYIKPIFLFGNFKEYLYLKNDACDIERKICEQFPNEPYVGAYYGTEPTLIVQDPKLIGLITSKEFNAFNSREISKYCDKETLTNSIIYTYGERWKQVKQVCTPLFTLLRLKNMFHMIEQCTRQLEKHLDEKTILSTSTAVEVRSVMVKYTIDCIASCILGVNSNTLNKKNESDPFKIIGEKVFEVSQWRKFLYIIRSMWPAVFYGLRFKAFPEEINTFFLNLYRQVCKSRQYKPSPRNDVIDHILRENKNEELVTGILISLFSAGFETTATSICHTLYELAKNEQVQDKAIQEVDEYLLRTNGEITYECVNELKYLEACTNEAMRLYPVLRVVTREVMENYTLPTGLHLEKGIRIHIPVYHIHRNPDNFPEPEQFRPERFLDDTIKPYTFMPFGEGMRQCVGKRFAKMQMLPSLVTVLKKYRISVADTMPALHHEVGSIVITPKGPITLKFTPREKK